MKTILKNSKRTQKYLKTRPKIYIICCWARWGVCEYPVGTFKMKDKILIPYVWQYNDHNGIADQYELISYDRTTSGGVYGWTFDLKIAKLLAEALNEKLTFK